MENTHLFHVLEQVGFYFVPHKKHKSKTTELMPRTLRKTFLLPLAAAAAAGLWSCHDDDTVYIIREIPTVAINDTWEHNDTSRAVSTGYISNLHPFGATLVGFINQRDELADTANIMSYGFQFCSDTTYAKIDQLLRQQDAQQAQQEIDRLWEEEGWKVYRYSNLFYERADNQIPDSYTVLKDGAKIESSVVCSAPGGVTYYRAFVEEEVGQYGEWKTVGGLPKCIVTPDAEIETETVHTYDGEHTYNILYVTYSKQYYIPEEVMSGFTLNHYNFENDRWSDDYGGDKEVISDGWWSDTYNQWYVYWRQGEDSISFQLRRGSIKQNPSAQVSYFYPYNQNEDFRVLLVGAKVNEEDIPEVSKDDLVDLGLSVKWASNNGFLYTYYWKDNVRTDWNCCDNDYTQEGWESRDRVDVAYEISEGKKRTPTAAEMKELAEKCTFHYYDYSNVACVGPNGNMILFRTDGKYYYNSPNSRGAWSMPLYYWSSDLSGEVSYDNIDEAVCLSFSSHIGWFFTKRLYYREHKERSVLSSLRVWSPRGNYLATIRPVENK